MYSHDITTAYIKLYEASLEKLASQYGEDPEENRDAD